MTTAVRKEKKYTYGDYLTWPDEERWEIIDGTPFNMAPAPSIRHQLVATELIRQVATLFLDKPCHVLSPPVDVLLPEDDEGDEAVHTVVQPDLLVVCDAQKMKKRVCRGAPDFVIEVVSPSTAQKDRIDKLNLYERHGVKEYWIVDPFYNIITVRVLGDDGRFGMPREYAGRGTLTITTFPDLVIDLDLVFR